MYGGRLTRDFGESVPSTWRSAINSLKDHEVQRGIRRLTAAGSSSAPTLPQFVKACKTIGDDEGEIHPASTSLPAPPITWQVRTGNLALFRFLLSRQGVPEDLVSELVAAKNKIVSTVHDDDDQAALVDVLRAAFERIAA